MMLNVDTGALAAFLDVSNWNEGVVVRDAKVAMNGLGLGYSMTPEVVIFTPVTNKLSTFEGVLRSTPQILDGLLEYLLSRPIVKPNSLFQRNDVYIHPPSGIYVNHSIFCEQFGRAMSLIEHWRCPYRVYFISSIRINNELQGEEEETISS